MKNLEREIVSCLFASVRPRPPGERWSFVQPQKGTPAFLGGIVHNLFVDYKYLRTACGLLFKLYPNLLSGVSMRDAERLLREFYARHLTPFDKSFEITVLGEKVSITPSILPDGTLEITILGQEVSITPPYLHDDIASEISKELESFIGSQLDERMYVALAARISVVENVNAGDLKLIRSKILSETVNEFLGGGFNIVENEQYPPVFDREKMRDVGPNDCWLICVSRTDADATAKFEMIKGALRVAMDFSSSSNISMAQPASGYVIFCKDGGIGQAFVNPTIPIIAGGFKCGKEHIHKLNALLSLSRLDDVRRMRMINALQYMAAGWTGSNLNGFMCNAVAFDALLGAKRQVRKSIVDGVAQLLSDHDRIRERVEMLLEIRNDVLHGSAASVEAADGYLNYFECFDRDPYIDQFYLLRKTTLRYVNQELGKVEY